MNTKTLNYLILLLALCAGIAAYCLFQIKQKPSELVPDKEASPSAESLIGQARPDFSMYNLEQELKHIKEWDGNIIVLNFWGTWCPPCLKEIPDLNRFYEQNNDKQVTVIGIAYDSADKVRQFAQDFEMHYPQLIDPMFAIELSKLYGNESSTLPYTVIIDKAGFIRYIHKSGIISLEELNKIVLGL